MIGVMVKDKFNRSLDSTEFEFRVRITRPCVAMMSMTSVMLPAHL